MAFLAIRNLHKYFGGLAAVHELDMDVNQGEILGLIGPNGAGKSTVLNMVGGTLFPTKGEILFQEENITNRPGYWRACRGIARVFQRNALFSSMTVLENVLVGSQLLFKHGFTEIFLKNASILKREKALRDRAIDVLGFVGLEKQANEMATNLSHGNQRALCLAVALATEPKLLLLDEPLTGMSAEEMAAIMDMIKTLRDKKGITSIVVEHNMRAVTGLCDRVVVLDYGKKIAEGPPKEVVQQPEVIEAYLGVEQDVT